MGPLKNVIAFLKEKTPLKRLVIRNTVFKKQVWDFEYKTGQWDYIDNPPSESVTSIIKRHLKGGAILDLGCGFGHTAGVLSEFDRYHGVDVSSVAIDRAKDRYDELEGVDYTCADIAAFEPAQRFDVILLREVIYYFDRDGILEILGRYRDQLNPDGVIILQLYSIEEQSAVIGLIRDNHEVLEEHFLDKSEDRQSIVMVI